MFNKMKFFAFFALLAVATATKCYGSARADGCEDCEGNEVSCSRCPSGKYLGTDKSCVAACTLPADKVFEGQCYVSCPHGAPEDAPTKCHNSFGGYLVSGVAILIAAVTLL
eukprot:TRINITY_DN1059_c0_g1_i10.p1 TRINITY_DN1059_c0_g1~~TRINITY_DN1059_c0_g1_i10.p1  ORF type:complete len:111 (-),score=14.24 TRINITY_DN1059_c0_g1_i10:204-536(-)